MLRFDLIQPPSLVCVASGPWLSKVHHLEVCISKGGICAGAHITYRFYHLKLKHVLNLSSMFTLTCKTQKNTYVRTAHNHIFYRSNPLFQSQPLTPTTELWSSPINITWAVFKIPLWLVKNGIPRSWIQKKTVYWKVSFHIIYTIYIYPMDPSTFSGSVWGIIYYNLEAFLYPLRQCLDPYWLVVSTPLKNMSQLGWWHSQYMGKMFQTTNQSWCIYCICI